MFNMRKKELSGHDLCRLLSNPYVEVMSVNLNDNTITAYDPKKLKLFRDKIENFDYKLKNMERGLSED